jgi:hypothetical protein
MKNPTQSLFFLLMFLLVSSFTSKNPSDFIGTYGVSDADPSQIQLSIYADSSFYYQDFSLPSKKIIVNGTWTLRGNTVQLQASNADVKFHKAWTFAENGKVAKSRKGMCFYRLCKKEK